VVLPSAAALLREMPQDCECFETGAIQRKRDIKNPDDLMRGCSFSAISKISQIGDITDAAFMKRFKNCNEWFKWIIYNITTNKTG